MLTKPWPANHIVDGSVHVWEASAFGHTAHLATYDGHLNLFAAPYRADGIEGVQLIDDHGLIHKQDLGVPRNQF
jgi:hypothetical protein